MAGSLCESSFLLKDVGVVVVDLGVVGNSFQAGPGIIATL